MATSEISSSNERHYYAKLEAIKDIRDKTLALEKLKVRIIKEVKLSDDEEKCLEEYRKEMEHLLEEKMSHVEELRQIHADINDMENIISRQRRTRRAPFDMAIAYTIEYLALKYQIRSQCERDYLVLKSAARPARGGGVVPIEGSFSDKLPSRWPPSQRLPLQPQQQPRSRSQRSWLAHTLVIP
ncbi:GL22723 [Drosophila persimilis]|uniref:GL22723 n=1 Tax=Drosophila persimilis TaxID=7234 RepID=B4HA33_DROPE|nr:GL22723 [Drosophila persimilis]